MNSIINYNREENKVYSDIIIEHFSNKSINFSIKTFGCQMNINDSNKLAGIFDTIGLLQCETPEDADILVINTCCVREHAESKVYGLIGSYKNYKTEDPNKIIVLLGCMTQQQDFAENIAKAYPYVDIIAGTNYINDIVRMLYNRITTGRQVVQVSDETYPIVENLPDGRKSRVSEFVTIMTGCNNFCTYCIVPKVRGRERSRRPEHIIEEINRLNESGCREIVLLGQNVNSYGLDSYLPSFAQLIRMIDTETDIDRIRFMTSHPKDLSDELIQAMSDVEKLCRHIHLPVQSGSDRILQMMNRKYTSEHYRSLCEKLRSSVPGIEITTDIIIGFPSESQQDFQDTLDLVKTVHYSSAFMFKYSIRKNTPAEKFEHQVDEDVKKQRLQLLIDTQEEITNEVNASYIGSVQRVLVEGQSTRSKGQLSGKTSSNITVNFEGTPEFVGKTVDIEITSNKSHTLVGKIR